MATWPASLPPPVITGFNGSPVQTFVRTEFYAGPPRQRQRFTNTPEEISLNWKFKPVEMAAFCAFWLDIRNGADWFSMPMDLGDGARAYDTRFRQPYKYQAAGINWIVTAEIEVRGA